MALLFTLSFFSVCTDTATTEIYTLSLHDALPIYRPFAAGGEAPDEPCSDTEHLHSGAHDGTGVKVFSRSEEHTSELQSRQYLVCRLLLEKKKKQKQKQSADKMQ